MTLEHVAKVYYSDAHVGLLLPITVPVPLACHHGVLGLCCTEG